MKIACRGKNAQTHKISQVAQKLHSARSQFSSGTSWCLDFCYSVRQDGLVVCNLNPLLPLKLWPEDSIQRALPVCNTLYW